MAVDVHGMGLGKVSFDSWLAILFSLFLMFAQASRVFLLTQSLNSI